jgi:hypothetical protein
MTRIALVLGLAASMVACTDDSSVAAPDSEFNEPWEVTGFVVGQSTMGMGRADGGVDQVPVVDLAADSTSGQPTYRVLFDPTKLRTVSGDSVPAAELVAGRKVRVWTRYPVLLSGLAIISGERLTVLN